MNESIPSTQKRSKLKGHAFSILSTTSHDLHSQFGVYSVVILLPRYDNLLNSMTTESQLHPLAKTEVWLEFDICKVWI